MSVFFDAAWFEARLVQLGLDRAALAAVVQIDAGDLDLVFADLRPLSEPERAAIAEALNSDILEVSLRAGAATRQAISNHSVRIESIEARLDAMDAWLADFEQQARKRA